MNKLSLYIHIPFCIKKCGYCDFVSFNYNETSMMQYLSYLKKEIVMNSDKSKQIHTVFIGGGTPSLMSGDMVKSLMDVLNDAFDMTTCKEVTLESNPGTITKEKLIAYKRAGINRVSIGVQTLNDETLKTLGRIHEVQTVYDTVDLFKEVGMTNFNMDLMFGLPGQSLEHLTSTVDKMIGLNPSHISAYSLKFEEGTPFYEKLEKGDLEALDDESDRAMYHCVVNKLNEAGYHQYEISNFSKEGYPCKHNLVYWEKKDYLGLGIAAHSCIGKERFYNVDTLEAYYKKIDQNVKPVEAITPIDEADDLFETIMLQLRLNEGLNVASLNEKFAIDFFARYNKVITQLKAEGLIEGDDVIRLTEKGRDLSNQVFISFLED